jgi:hypothetical protein
MSTGGNKEKHKWETATIQGCESFLHVANGIDKA